MRRSAAPSARAAKKMKFCSPFKAQDQEPSVEISTTRSVLQQSYKNQVTIPEIRAEVSKSDLKTASTNTLLPRFPKDFTVQNRKEVKSDDEIKDTTSTGLSYPSLSSKVAPFKPQRSSKPGSHLVPFEEKENICRYFSVVWGKMSKKKHKKWEGDGILVTRGRTASLKDLEGKEIAKSAGYKSSELELLQEGNTLCIGGKEIEVMGLIKAEDYLSGQCFQQSIVSSFPTKPISRMPPKKTGFVKPYSSNVKRDVTTDTRQMVAPRHDVNAPGAVVMPRPNATHQFEHNREGLDIIDVVVDPHLSGHLRPHQRDGVVFLYECIMGLRNFNGNGAILADDMGLGKTFQCISLIWTLHKQGMYGGQASIRRTLIITPGSLVKNWSSEFRKWLGNERLKVYTVNSDKRVKEFINSPIYPVMIISYEMFLRSVEEVRNIKFGLVICDEAHRLKNTSIKTATMISGLKTKRRILLTGTPVQNDLKEFHSLVDVCNPGILGTQSSFRRLYEEPIVRGQQPDASSEEKLLGQTRAAELNRLTSLFFLRRTAEVNSRYLPPKVECVVFCRPSLLQLSLYRHLLTSRVVRSCLTSHSSGGSRHLVCIGALKKLCNDPSLIYSHCQEAKEMEDGLDVDEDASLYEGLDRSFPENFNPGCFTTNHSGKLQALGHILTQIRSTRERVVLVSNYTQTLDLLQRLCEDRGYDFLRLDGKTPTSKRQSLVDRFNDKYCKIFVFLLSSKAGGVGLNLIGASRLILYDIDWNPANDIQSMARVWRDGQKNTVHIYRLLTTGTIEEKIYQRQTAKQGLSGTVADAKESVKIEFSREELKDLFTLHENTLCLTHDLLQCTCLTTEDGSDEECQSESTANQQSSIPVTRPCQLGIDINNNQKNLSIAELMDWQHYPCPSDPCSDFEDDAVKKAGDAVSFVFRTKTFGQETVQQESRQ
ncbi:DNA repair and recombination protein RAD54B-like [Pocillopora damicornis]|uniref:DNA repair and recombination protein RAD54B-like n=1 Tax=Pocillopora damicornis TaxID=46731 RepID=UPI000F5598A4|nr:DNA repair and recombination protein RAD54B-like [Pocillopora damicornis]